MKKLISFNLILCIFAILLTACENVKTATVSGENAQFTTLRIDSAIVGEKIGDTNQTWDTEQHIIYPVFVGATADLLNKAVIKMFCDDSLKAASVRQCFNKKNIFMEYAMALKESPGVKEIGFSRRDSIFVGKSTSKIISLTDYKEVFIGGAHGWEEVIHKNLNPVTGAEYKIEDFFKPNIEEELTKIGEKCFREQFLPKLGFKPTDALSEASCFHGGIFYLSGNCGLAKTGITFVYSNYEIGSFSLGTPEFTIPFSQLNPLLKKEWAAEFAK